MIKNKNILTAKEVNALVREDLKRLRMMGDYDTYGGVGEEELHYRVFGSSACGASWLYPESERILYEGVFYPMEAETEKVMQRWVNRGCFVDKWGGPIWLLSSVGLLIGLGASAVRTEQKNNAWIREKVKAYEKTLPQPTNMVEYMQYKDAVAQYRDSLDRLPNYKCR